jgi:hypothetical protein
MDAEALLQDGNTSGADIPSSPEDLDQEDVNMDVDELSEGKRSFSMDGLSSPQSQYSFGINLLSLPEEMGDFGPILTLSHQVQDHGTEPTLPKMDEALRLETQETGITSLTARQEDMVEDFSRPVEAETLIGNPLAAQEDVGMHVPQSTEVEGLGNSSKAHSTYQLL